MWAVVDLPAEQRSGRLAVIMEAIPQFFSNYRKSTAQRIKLIDLFLLYIVLTGVVQFIYCALVGTFPFNSFLSGFISCVGSFILTGTLSDIDDSSSSLPAA